jgi:hypothetical protein
MRSARLTDAEIETEERKRLTKNENGLAANEDKNQKNEDFLKKISENSKQKKISLRSSTMDEKKD